MFVDEFTFACVASFCCFLTASCLTVHHVPKLNSTVMNFDEVVTKNGLADVPSSYSYLKFSTFIIFTPNDPALSKFISENDLNCAVSLPNALLGSRRYERGAPASFEIANASSMVAAGLQPHFTLLSFNVKPMDAPPPGVTIWVRGYSHVQKPVEWHVDFVSGYHLPLLVDICKFSGMPWNHLYRVEISANFGQDDLDWEFCLDDLEVHFYPLTTEDRRPANLGLKEFGTWTRNAFLHLLHLWQ